MLENTAPFGRDMRGVSYVFATKDRPGHLRANGRPSKNRAKRSSARSWWTTGTDGPDFTMRFFAPKDDEDKTAAGHPAAEVADIVHGVIAALPERTVASARMLFAEIRKSGPPVPRRQHPGRGR